MAEAEAIIKRSYFGLSRTWILVISVLLFLPPLSFVFQMTQDANFCGTWCPRMFFVWRQGMSGQQFLFGMLRSYMGVLLVFGIIITTFIFGRYWCSHLCPIGGSIELSSKIIPDKFKINFQGVNATPIRYGYLLVYFVAPAVGIGSLCCSYCNFATIPRIFGAFFNQADLVYFFRTAGLINLGLVLLLGMFARGGRAYCNLLCPVGAIDAISNKLGGKKGRRYRINQQDCTGCRDCTSVCPTWAIEVEEKARINSLSCMPCGNCQKACPSYAITYGKA